MPDQYTWEASWRAGSGGVLGLEVVAGEPGDAVQGGVRLGEDGGEGLEDVRHAGGDVEGDGDVVGGGLGRQAGGVVEEDLV